MGMFLHPMRRIAMLIRDNLAQVRQVESGAQPDRRQAARSSRAAKKDPTLETVRYGPVRHRWQIQGKVDRTDGWCSQPFANLTRRKSTIALTFRGTKARLG